MFTTEVLRAPRLSVTAAVAFTLGSCALAANAQTAGNTPPCAADKGAVTVTSDQMRQQLVHLTPVYPVSAPAGASGTVVLNVVVDCTGKVTNNTVASGPEALASASSAAVNTWTYKPYLVNGVAVPVQSTVVLTFGLNK
jgi:periplasmic protein TonB